MTPRAAAPLLGLLVCTITGCGLLFTKGPPAGSENLQSFHCTTSDAGPWVDLGVGIVNLFGSLIIVGDPEKYGYDNSTTPLISAAIWTAILVPSAVIGFNKVEKCRAALRDLARRQKLAPTAAAARIDSVRIRPAVSTVAVGVSAQLEALAFGGGSILAPAPTFRWLSANEAIAWITPSGLVTGVAPGTVVIAATAGNAVGTTTVVVRSPP